MDTAHGLALTRTDSKTQQAWTRDRRLTEQEDGFGPFDHLKQHTRDGIFLIPYFMS